MTPTIFLNLLCLLTFNSLVIAGLYIASRYELKRDIPTFSVKPKLKDIDEGSKNLLWRLSFYSELWLGHFYAKPVINCMVCMASVHSTYVYWLEFIVIDKHLVIHLRDLTVDNFIMYLFYVPCLAFINLQLSKLT